MRLGPKVVRPENFSSATLDLPLLRYFKKINGRWTIDEDLLAGGLELINEVDRPVVVYFSSNHLTDSNVSLASPLAANNQNLVDAR
jgi:hypothetical protein